MTAYVWEPENKDGPNLRPEIQRQGHKAEEDKPTGNGNEEVGLLRRFYRFIYFLYALA